MTADSVLTVSLCLTLLGVAALAWHGWLQKIATEADTQLKLQQAKSEQLHATVQEELIQRQALLEKRLQADIEKLTARVQQLDVNATTEFASMKREFDKLTSKEGVHAYLNQSGKMF